MVEIKWDIKYIWLCQNGGNIESVFWLKKQKIKAEQKSNIIPSKIFSIHTKRKCNGIIFSVSFVTDANLKEKNDNDFLFIARWMKHYIN
jgi:hypothetical protein